MGAGYFTSQPHLPPPVDAEGFLGHLGSFVITMLPNSTLKESPHYQRSRVQSYSDYDAEWENILIKYKLSSASTASSALDNLMRSANGLGDAEWAAITAGFSANAQA